MHTEDSVETMWREYLASLEEDPERTDKRYLSWYFCDNETDAAELAKLVLRGIKRATASLKQSYEHDGEPLPAPGDLSVITDYHGTARCIIRTTAVHVLPFRDMPAEFAAREGEMEVVCEDFELVWPE